MQKMDGRTESQTDTELWHSNLIWSALNKVICKIAVQYVKACKRKVRKPIFSILSSTRGITPTKIDRNWQHWNLICSKVKQNHMQNFSSICQSVQEKSAENCISSILRSKRGITPTEIDGNWQHWNLICSTVKESHMQNFSLIYQSM